MIISVCSPYIFLVLRSIYEILRGTFNPYRTMAMALGLSSMYMAYAAPGDETAMIYETLMMNFVFLIFEDLPQLYCAIY